MQSAQSFSDNLIAAWHLSSRLSIVFSCLFSRHMECATYFFVAEARQLLVGRSLRSPRISVDPAVGLQWCMSCSVLFLSSSR